MKTIDDARATTLSDEAKARMEDCDHGALFYADWTNTVFIHYEVAPEDLQRLVPFPLDLRNGKAYISLVAFNFSNLRLRYLPILGRFLCRPLSEHGFLNVRTYVRMGSETGIYFLAEWLNNRFAVPLGPQAFGLPYRFGRLNYEHCSKTGEIRGRVQTDNGIIGLEYDATLPTAPCFAPCAAGTLDEFLLERFTAFTHYNGRNRFFRIWHRPWPQRPIDLTINRDDLLTDNWPFFRTAKYIGAHYSSGVRDVWMGVPHDIPPADKHHRLNTFFQMP